MSLSRDGSSLHRGRGEVGMGEVGGKVNKGVVKKGGVRG